MGELQSPDQPSGPHLNPAVGRMKKPEIQNLQIKFSSVVEKPFVKYSLHHSNTVSSALSSAGYLKVIVANSVDPDQTAPFRSSLIWVHTVCLYAKCKFEKFARRCSRRYKQTTFSDADFLGA